MQLGRIVSLLDILVSTCLLTAVYANCQSPAARAATLIIPFHPAEPQQHIPASRIWKPRGLLHFEAGTSVVVSGSERRRRGKSCPHRRLSSSATDQNKGSRLRTLSAEILPDRVERRNLFTSVRVEEGGESSSDAHNNMRGKKITYPGGGALAAARQRGKGEEDTNAQRMRGKKPKTPRWGDKKDDASGRRLARAGSRTRVQNGEDGDGDVDDVCRCKEPQPVRLCFWCR